MARKNANGNGSRPRKRPDGRWEARYWADTPEGRKRKSIYGATSKEAADKLLDAMSGEQDATPTEETNAAMTFAEFFTQHEQAAEQAMKRRSFETYRSIVHKHLLPAFGPMPLEDLNRQHVQRMYSQKRDQGLSAARVKRIHGVLSAALNKAVLWRLVERNVCKEVSPPRVPPPEIRPLSLEEAKCFLAAAEHDRYSALMVVGVSTGARWGELAALNWSAIDTANRKMHIQRSLIKGKGGYTFDVPKTRGSRRTVNLTGRAVSALLDHKQRQHDEGISTAGDALVFTNTVGNPVNHSHFMRRHFRATLERAGLPHTSWHAATRHTCTCILLLAKVNPKSVAMQMGWSSVAFMLDTYARFLPGWGDDGVMDSVLG